MATSASQAPGLSGQRLHGENAAARRFLKQDWPIPANGERDFRIG
jgi:hypothetical protein